MPSIEALTAGNNTSAVKLPRGACAVKVTHTPTRDCGVGRGVGACEGCGVGKQGPGYAGTRESNGVYCGDCPEVKT